jgi:hypothetical protein
MYVFHEPLEVKDTVNDIKMNFIPNGQNSQSHKNIPARIREQLDEVYPN